MGDVVSLHKNQSYSIDDLALAFLKWAEKVYGNSDFCNYKTAIKTMLEIYSGIVIHGLKRVGHFFENLFQITACHPDAENVTQK